MRGSYCNIYQLYFSRFNVLLNIPPPQLLRQDPCFTLLSLVFLLLFYLLPLFLVL